MVEEKKKGTCEDVANETNQDFDGGMQRRWAGIKEKMRKQGGETDKETATVGAQNSRMVDN